MTMTPTFRVHKASAIGDHRIAGAVIEIVLDQPTDRNVDWMKTSEARFQADAESIVGALEQLPGGTLHRVLVELLKRKLCLYAVRDVPQTGVAVEIKGATAP